MASPCWATMRLYQLSVMDSRLNLELNLADLLKAPNLRFFTLLCARVGLTGFEGINSSVFQDRRMSVEVFTTAPFTSEETSLLEKLSFTVGRCENNWPARSCYFTDEEIGPYPLWMAKLKI